MEHARDMIPEVAIDADESGVIRLAFERHQAALFRLAGLLCGDRAEAEDIVQETFLRATPKLGHISEEEQLAYLRTVCLNLWRSRYRRLTVARRHSDRRTRDAGTHASPFEERDEMWKAVLRLPPRQRACLVLRFYEDLLEREIAVVLGCSVGTVKSQTSRGLAKLREEFGDGDRTEAP